MAVGKRERTSRSVGAVALRHAALLAEGKYNRRRASKQARSIILWRRRHLTSAITLDPTTMTGEWGLEIFTGQNDSDGGGGGGSVGYVRSDRMLNERKKSIDRGHHAGRT